MLFNSLSCCNSQGYKHTLYFNKISDNHKFSMNSSQWNGLLRPYQHDNGNTLSARLAGLFVYCFRGGHYTKAVDSSSTEHFTLFYMSRERLK